MDTKVLSQSIKHNRELLHFTQEKLAECLGVSTHYIYELERGTKLPSLPTLISLAEVFHVSIDSLLNENNGKNYETDDLDRLINNLSNENRAKLYEILCNLLPYLKL